MWPISHVNLTNLVQPMAWNTNEVFQASSFDFMPEHSIFLSLLDCSKDSIRILGCQKQYGVLVSFPQTLKLVQEVLDISLLKRAVTVAFPTFARSFKQWSYPVLRYKTRLVERIHQGNPSASTQTGKKSDQKCVYITLLYIYYIYLFKQKKIIIYIYSYWNFNDTWCFFENICF